jgi:hypothetical protein
MWLLCTRADVRSTIWGIPVTNGTCSTAENRFKREQECDKNFRQLINRLEATKKRELAFYIVVEARLDHPQLKTPPNDVTPNAQVAWSMAISRRTFNVVNQTEQIEGTNRRSRIFKERTNAGTLQSIHDGKRYSVQRVRTELPGFLGAHQFD